MKTFTIGQSVKTPHGTGTIKEQELANDAYPNQTPRMIATGRYGVTLDAGHTWAIQGKTAYYFPTEIDAV